jgi:hypothetical protein
VNLHAPPLAQGALLHRPLLPANACRGERRQEEELCSSLPGPLHGRRVVTHGTGQWGCTSVYNRERQWGRGWRRSSAKR